MYIALVVFLLVCVVLISAMAHQNWIAYEAQERLTETMLWRIKQLEKYNRDLRTEHPCGPQKTKTSDLDEKFGTIVRG